MLPVVNTTAMNVDLAEISRTVAPGAHFVAPDNIAPDNIALLTRPRYSPELNPVKNV